MRGGESETGKEEEPVESVSLLVTVLDTQGSIWVQFPSALPLWMAGGWGIYPQSLIPTG